MFVVAEHVEARTGGRQQHGITGLRVGGCFVHGSLERGCIDQRDTGTGQRLADSRRIAADQHHRARVLRDRRGQRREILALAVSARNQHDVLGQTGQRRHRCADIGALAVVKEFDVIERGDEFDAVRLAGVIAQAVQQCAHRQADRAAQGECGHRIRGVMQAADAQCVRRHQALETDRHGRGGRRVALLAARRLGKVVVLGFSQHDPRHAALAQQAKRIGRSRLVGAKGHVDGLLACERHHAGILAVQHAHGAGAENAALGCGVGLHRAVPVKVVLRDVEDGRGVGIQRMRGLELEAGQFEHPYVGQRARVDAFAELVERRRADVAGHTDGLAGTLGQRARERRRGGLAVGTRDGQHTRRVGLRGLEASQRARKQFDLAPDGHRAFAGGGKQRSDVRIQRRQAGADRHQRHAFQQRCGKRAAHEFGVRHVGAQGRQVGRRLARIGHAHARTVAGAPACHGEARLAQAEHQHEGRVEFAKHARRLRGFGRRHRLGGVERGRDDIHVVVGAGGFGHVDRVCHVALTAASTSTGRSAPASW